MMLYILYALSFIYMRPVCIVITGIILYCEVYVSCKAVLDIYSQNDV